MNYKSNRYQSISSHLALTWNSSNHLWLDRTSLLYMQTSKYIIGTNGDMKFFYTKKCNKLYTKINKMCNICQIYKKALM